MTTTTPVPPWTKQQTIDLISADPLPSNFLWPHKDGGNRPVVPSHQSLRGGYGKWLSEGPQFPGLFELINDILADADRSGSDASWLACEELRTTGVAFESWGQFLALELRALGEKHRPALTGEEPPAHVLRQLRTRPPEPLPLLSQQL